MVSYGVRDRQACRIPKLIEFGPGLIIYATCIPLGKNQNMWDGTPWHRIRSHAVRTILRDVRTKRTPPMNPSKKWVFIVACYNSGSEFSLTYSG